MRALVRQHLRLVPTPVAPALGPQTPRTMPPALAPRFVLHDRVRAAVGAADAAERAMRHVAGAAAFVPDRFARRGGQYAWLAEAAPPIRDEINHGQ